MSYDTLYGDYAQDVAVVVDTLPTADQIDQINAVVTSSGLWSLKIYKMVVMRQGGSTKCLSNVADNEIILKETHK